MSIPFRIRRAEWIAGAFLLLAVAALVASLVLLSRARGSFEATATYHVTLDDGYGITPGGRVEMLGIDIGRIESLEISDDNRVSAQLEIRERFAPRLRTDSIARVKASLDLQGVLGGVGLAISPGSPDAELLPPGSSIEVAEPRSVADLLPMVKGDPLVEDFEALIHNARKMSDTVADPESPAYKALSQANDLLAKIQDRKSTIGRILQDDGEMYERLVGTLDDVERSMSRLEKVLARSGGLMRRADGLVDSGDVLMKKAGGMVESGDRAFTDMGPVLENSDTAMKSLDEAVRAFAETTRALQEVVEAMVPLIEDMDDMVETYDDVGEAAKKVWPIRRHVRKADRKK